MNARYYAPELRRFISADTIVPQPGNPQAFNRYAYTYQNPVNFVDPTGHFTDEAIWNHIFESICNQDISCTSNTIQSWQADEEWWQMLLLAKAGDTVLGQQRLRNGQRPFKAVFEGTEDTQLDGIEFYQGACNTKLCTAKRYHDFGLKSADYIKNKQWGVLLQGDSMHFRLSVASKTRIESHPDEGGIWGKVSTVGSSALGSGLCTVAGVTSVPGSVACGAVAATIDMVARSSSRSQIPGRAAYGNSLWEVAGHRFLRQPIDGTGMSSPESALVTYYGHAWGGWVW